MHALYDLKEMLCKQLEDYGKKGEMSAAVLERVDMLAHAAKNLDKIIEKYEESEYSEASDGRSYRGGVYDGRVGSYRDDGRSMARGRGSNAKRDSMGRYSRDGYSRTGELADQLRDMMEEAPDDRTRQDIERLASKLESR